MFERRDQFCIISQILVGPTFGGIPGRTGIFANDEWYIDWDLASNCDPLSGSPRVQNVVWESSNLYNH